MHTYTQITRSIAATLLALVAAFTLYVPHAAAIGISPPLIHATDVLRNSAQTFTVTLLVENLASRDLYFDAVPRGQYAHYLKGPSELIIPQGKTSAVYTFTLEPTNAAVGAYDLQLAFTERPAPTEGAEGGSGASPGAKVSVLQGAILIIKMTVSGDEKVSFGISRPTFEDTELRLPLVGTYTVNNNGNVEWKPDRIEVIVTDVNDAGNTETYTVTGDDIPLTKPGTTVDSPIVIAHKLVEGKYKAHLKFYYKDAVVTELESTAFNVFSPGTLNQSGELVQVSTNKESYNIGEQIVLKGLFKNTGDVTVQGQLETTIYKDGSLVNLEVSRSLNIDRRQETEFQQFLKLDEPGTYQLEVAATFGNRKTPAHNLTITVEAAGVGQVGSTFISIALVLLLVIGIFIFLFWFVRHQKKKEETAKMGAPVAPAVTPAAAPATAPSIPVAAPAAPVVVPEVPQAPAAPAVSVPAVAPVTPVVTEAAPAAPLEPAAPMPIEPVVVTTGTEASAPQPVPPTSGEMPPAA